MYSFSRYRHINRFQTKDGDKVKITADDLRGDDIEKLLEAINPMIKGTK